MKRIHYCLILLLLITGAVSPCRGYSIIVAAANSSAAGKARADLVCNGIADQHELELSFTRVSNHSVLWLPGDYYLTDTLDIPLPGANSVIDAQGTYLHYQPSSGDAVVIRGLFGSRYNLGTIETSSDGAALRIQNPSGVNALMSITTFNGLVGHNQQGIGLHLDPSQEGLGTARYDGLEIRGFDTGVLLGEPATGGARKNDTNWFFINHIRDCNIGVREFQDRTDDHVYRLNINMSLPNSVGVRSGAYHGKWDLMLKSSGGAGTKAFILDPGAAFNVFEIHPPLDQFNYEDNSGNNTNIFLSATQPPYFIGANRLCYLSFLPGDFDFSGLVDANDFAILTNNWIAAGSSPLYWDATESWSDGSNPNGVWSYNDLAGNPIPTHVESWVGIHGSGQPAWAPGNADVPGWAKIDDNVPWSDMPIGSVITHGPSSLTWTSPRDDTIFICGGVWLPPDRGRSMNWSILHNGVPFTAGTVAYADGSSGNPLHFDQGSGGNAVLTRPVAAGDVIKFDFQKTGASPADEFVGIKLRIYDKDNPNLYPDGFIDLFDFSVLTSNWMNSLF